MTIPYLCALRACLAGAGSAFRDDYIKYLSGFMAAARSIYEA